jgi:hypothetical protein
MLRYLIILMGMVAMVAMVVRYVLANAVARNHERAISVASVEISREI